MGTKANVMLPAQTPAVHVHDAPAGQSQSLTVPQPQVPPSRQLLEAHWLFAVHATPVAQSLAIWQALHVLLLELDVAVLELAVTVLELVVTVLELDVPVLVWVVDERFDWVVVEVDEPVEVREVAVNEVSLDDTVPVVAVVPWLALDELRPELDDLVDPLVELVWSCELDVDDVCPPSSVVASGPASPTT